MCRFCVYPHIRFGKKIKVNTWDPVASKWTVETTDGEKFTGDVVISGMGALHVPKYPNFPGMDLFQGEAFHTNAWPEVVCLELR